MYCQDKAAKIFGGYYDRTQSEEQGSVFPLNF